MRHIVCLLVLSITSPAFAGSYAPLRGHDSAVALIPDSSVVVVEVYKDLDSSARRAVVDAMTSAGLKYLKDCQPSFQNAGNLQLYMFSRLQTRSLLQFRRRAEDVNARLARKEVKDAVFGVGWLWKDSLTGTSLILGPGTFVVAFNPSLSSSQIDSVAQLSSWVELRYAEDFWEREVLRKRTFRIMSPTRDILVETLLLDEKPQIGRILSFTDTGQAHLRMPPILQLPGRFDSLASRGPRAKIGRSQSWLLLSYLLEIDGERGAELWLKNVGQSECGECAFLEAAVYLKSDISAEELANLGFRPNSFSQLHHPPGPILGLLNVSRMNDLLNSVAVSRLQSKKDLQTPSVR